MFGPVFGNVQTEEGYMSKDLRGEMLRTNVAFCSVCWGAAIPGHCQV